MFLPTSLAPPLQSAPRSISSMATAVLSLLALVGLTVDPIACLQQLLDLKRLTSLEGQTLLALHSATILPRLFALPCLLTLPLGLNLNALSMTMKVQAILTAAE